MLTRRRTLLATATAACAALLLATPMTTSATTPSPAESTAAAEAAHAAKAIYLVHKVGTPELRSAVARTGIDVMGADGDVMSVRASEAEVRVLRAKGFEVEFRAAGEHGDRSHGDLGIADFPPADAAYHNFAEVTAELRKAEADHSGIAQLRSIGKSHENRDLWMIKISDNVAADENEPEVLFNCNQHAREHLTVEMCLRIVNRFTDGYTTDPAIKSFVDSREIWVIPSVNPDGSEYDVATGSYRSWRKNRQAPAGTDLNRNWDYNWGCCGGSSGSTSSDTYRGPSAFSAPETARLRDFVNSRVVGGKQQITANIDFHTFSELVLWPYGYTTADTGPGLTADDARTFQTLGRQMAATNNYKPQQSSDLYITDGSSIDWMWGRHKIWSYTFEMFPSSIWGGGFYPPDEVINRETSRNDRAVDLMLTYADCVPRVIGKTC
ncbi:MULTISPECIES: M14 family zinc carboxypeptidase [unclassified Crossiella]|uniref:M14 family zinc carboxypeptidase n=1 Tax=unclassified Crossiella TaxID=2620835 RepID=UPI00200009FC|nr:MULTISPECIES: M14 family zinc carboxypeptidase [unclassified Crossiella]MCK2243262.1 zinc carboxypeptidase [Crossiella sp. S99.2]MCK2254269.1 zinc carboxypeptidase [Crossiella sp. S99.1]